MASGAAAMRQAVTLPEGIPDFSADISRQAIASAQSGNWSSPGTWLGGQVPTLNHVVRVVLGHTVTIDDTSAVAYTIAVDGTLAFAPTVNTRLKVTNLQVMAGEMGMGTRGILQVGTVATPIAAAVTAEIVIANSPLGGGVTDTAQFGTGLMIFGKASMHGSPRTPTFVRLATEPLAGHTTLTLSAAVSGWRVGDRLVLPDTRHIKESEVVGPTNPWLNAVNQWEERTVQALSADGVTVTLNLPLQYHHLGARDQDGVLDSGFLPHVGNLTRNVIIRSENPAGTRGHMLGTHVADVDLRYVLFKDLGRTTFKPLNTTTNHIGRYPVHIHHLSGPLPTPANGYQFTLLGNAVDGGSAATEFKWGIAVHGSHYGLIQDNVVYNYNGASVATENGSESFNVFDHNFALRGMGEPNDLVNNIEARSAMGTEGVGFWFRGPNNYVRNNVAANFQNSTTEAAYGFVYQFLRLGNIATPSFKGADTFMGVGQSTIVNGNNLPLLQFDNNEAYGAMQGGFTYWWISSEDPNPFAGAQESRIRDLKLWNIFNKAVYMYPGQKVTFDRLKIRGGFNAQSQCCGNGVFAADYSSKGIVIRDSDIQGMEEGITAPEAGFGPEPNLIIQNSYLRNVDNVVVPFNGSVNGCWMANKLVVISNTVFAAMPGRISNNIEMVRDVANVSSFCLNVLDEARVYAYNGIATDNFQVYHPDADVLPRPPASCTPTTRPGIVGLLCPIAALPPVPPTATLSVFPASISAVPSTTLSWSTTNATSVSFDRGIGSVASSGTRNVSPTETTTYTLTATTTDGSVTPNVATAAVTITVSSTPVITWPPPAPITVGTALNATQLNATAPVGVAGTFVYRPASGTLLAAGAGQTLSVTFTPSDTATYNVATATVPITVLRSTPVITWPTPAAILVGTALGGTQLNATTPVAGTFAYTPSSGMLLGAGAGQTLSVTFTPNDTATYNVATATVAITVLRSTPVITWATPAAITVGTALGGAQLNATAPVGVAGTFVYTPASGTLLGVGAGQTLSVTFTPNDTATYNVATTTVPITVLLLPTVTSISPASGGTAGGTAVTISGTGFATGATVAIGGIAATSVNVVNAQTITAVTAAHSPGVVDVVVTNPGGQLATRTNGFTYVLSPPTLTVNGQAGAVTAAGGSTLTVGVSNGPAYRGDWVMMVPAGSAPQTWGVYQYLNGTRTAPATGVSTATLMFPAPGAGGTFEFRFYQNDNWMLLATSGAVTVTVTAANPVPTVATLSPASVMAGAPGFSLTVNGSGFVPASQVRVTGTARTTTYVSATTLTTAIGAGELASAGTLAITVSSPTPGGGTSGTVNFIVTATALTPALSINGGPGPVTVLGGSTITVGVSNGPGFRADWVMMVPAGSPPQTWGVYQYFSGTKTAPPTGSTSATLMFPAPPAGGTFEFRLYENDTFTLRATSSAVTVTAANPVPTVAMLSPASVMAGAPAFTLTVTGTGFVSASQVRVNGSPRATTYVSATALSTAIGAGDVSTTGTVAISVSSPTPGGGTSGTVNLTVTAPATSPMLTINGQSGPVTVVGGSTLTVRVSNGPGFRADWVMMVPAGSPPQTWGVYQYFSGTKTAPPTGSTSATLMFQAPPAGGTFEFRLYENDSFTLRATSGVASVTASNPVPTVSMLSPASVMAGAPGFTLTVTGTGVVSASQILVNGNARTTTYVSTTTLTTVLGASDVSSARMLAISVSSPTPGGGTSGSVNFTVTAPAPLPTLSINGGSGPATVMGGWPITVDVANGPGNRADWVMMVPAGSPPQTWGVYQYFSGTRIAPATGSPTATLRFPAPPAGGTFEFRLYENDSWTLRATSSIVTVTEARPLRTVVHATGFSQPVAIVQDPTNAAVQFVVQQSGRIRVVSNGAVLPTDFLDLNSAILGGGERGLLGLALAPDYAVSGRFFVNFTSVSDGGTVVARFRRSADPLVANASSRFDLRWSGGATTIPRPFANHNGGNLAFGPDGFLYIGLGDGGSGGDPFNLAQNPAELHGKMLRIDVNVADAHPTGYQIPSSNPFVGSSLPGVRPEIWSMGWRNPWRYSFDDVSRGGTGALIVGDVGEATYEEVDYEPANRGGRNYGWDAREGAHVKDPATTPAYLPLTDPVVEYTHAVGGSITGGFVYRGTALGSPYQGRYFFADFVSGRVWSVALTIDPVTGEATASSLRDHTSELGPAALGNISSFGVDSDGELFILSYFSGTVLRVLPEP